MWKIWFKSYFNGRYLGRSVSTIYTLKYNEAVKEARRLYRDHGGYHYEWVVSMTDPWPEGATMSVKEVD